ncbi:MAG TPA: hypothetical protein VEW65_14840, partial [Chryseolinea sp.]|nr:hypothetical protein [Chryseolinea sp.]
TLVRMLFVSCSQNDPFLRTAYEQKQTFTRTDDPPELHKSAESDPLIRKDTQIGRYRQKSAETDDKFFCIKNPR